MNKKNQVGKTNGETENKTVKLVTIEQLQQENQTLKNKLEEISSKPKSLEDQIAYYERKRKKINHLRQFESTKEKIEESQQALKEESEKGSFTAERHKLIFGKVNYNGELTAEAFKISNVELLTKFTEFIMCEIQNKIAQLEKEISE